MATNKHATIRYHALDRCFGNHRRKFFIEDLIKACNEAIYDFAGITDGVKRRQVFDDIAFMESEQGYSVPLERMKEGRRTYYRYQDPNFSIKQQGISTLEAEKLNETLTILSRFKGMPHFEWIEEIQIRLTEAFKLKGHFKASVAFEQNPFLKGLHYFSELFNAIQNESVLGIMYQGYKQENAIETVIHPWYLKQYNSRWFLFGYNQEYRTVTNLALDRIKAMAELPMAYVKNDIINFEEYFEDIVGVTYKSDLPVEKILLSVKAKLWPYIESKPLHGSQRIKSVNDQEVLIELTVQVNHEFMALIFSYMDGVEIVKPQGLRDKFKSVSESLFHKYI